MKTDPTQNQDPLFSVPPSVFKAASNMGSVTQNCESETVARNIMVIRDRRGEWDLTEKEYEEERKKDGNFTGSEFAYFRKVYPLTHDSVSAMAFAPGWGKAGREYLDSKK